MTDVDTQFIIHQLYFLVLIIWIILNLFRDIDTFDKIFTRKTVLKL